MHMKRRAFIFFYPITAFVLLFLSGCAEYQYVTVDSGLDKADKQQYYYENDSLRINYTFAGPDFKVTTTVFNKMDQPLYVDWQKSAVVLDSQQMDDAYKINGLDGFIAPHSNLSVTSNILIDQFFNVRATNHEEGKGSENANERTGHAIQYSDSVSPMHVRSILALTSNNDLSDPIYFDSPFYVSGIKKTFSGPLSTQELPQNQFYLKRETGFGKFMGWTGALALILALAALGG